jgi:hypothetical protein
MDSVNAFRQAPAGNPFPEARILTELDPHFCVIPAHLIFSYEYPTVGYNNMTNRDKRSIFWLFIISSINFECFDRPSPFLKVEDLKKGMYLRDFSLS